ncbi:MAG: hypothetical protein ACRC68_01730 [Clostridium sp.]
MGKNNLNYLKSIIIVHGKSEKQMCDFIKSKLKLNIHIESEKKGEKSIQITSVMNILRNTIYKSFKSFEKNFIDVEVRKIKSKKTLVDYFKIFIVMDTDDCTKEQKEAFISKSMFRDHWAYEYIVPIYNDKNLEDVLEKCDIKYEKKGIDRKKEYIKIFPTDKKYEKKDSMQVEEFKEKVKLSKKTNMDELIESCIEYSKDNIFM